nr:MAG TPA: hypothetical protein [Bacteriophage sp.]
MAVTYKLYAAEVSRLNVEKAERERFSRVTANYMLLYRRTKPRHIPTVEVKGDDLRRLTESDRLWLADCIATLLGEAAGKRQDATARRVSEMLTAWEKELQRTREGMKKETQDGRNEKSDN